MVFEIARAGRRAIKVDLLARVTSTLTFHLSPKRTMSSFMASQPKLIDILIPLWISTMARRKDRLPKLESSAIQTRWTKATMTHSYLSTIFQRSESE